jgi:hypothetical protein
VAPAAVSIRHSRNGVGNGDTDRIRRIGLSSLLLPTAVYATVHHRGPTASISLNGGCCRAAQSIPAGITVKCCNTSVAIRAVSPFDESNHLTIAQHLIIHRSLVMIFLAALSAAHRAANQLLCSALRGAMTLTPRRRTSHPHTAFIAGGAAAVIHNSFLQCNRIQVVGA